VRGEAGRWGDDTQQEKKKRSVRVYQVSVWCKYPRMDPGGWKDIEMGVVSQRLLC
jgi:hypothetical protein